MVQRAQPRNFCDAAWVLAKTDIWDTIWYFFVGPSTALGAGWNGEWMRDCAVCLICLATDVLGHVDASTITRHRMATTGKSATTSRGQFSTFLNILLDSMCLNSQRIQNLQSTWDVWPHIVATNGYKCKMAALRWGGHGHIQIPTGEHG